MLKGLPSYLIMCLCFIVMMGCSYVAKRSRCHGVFRHYSVEPDYCVFCVRLNVLGIAISYSMRGGACLMPQEDQILLDPLYRTPPHK